jgi:serine/threonine protein kinase
MALPLTGVLTRARCSARGTAGAHLPLPPTPTRVVPAAAAASTAVAAAAAAAPPPRRGRQQQQQPYGRRRADALTVVASATAKDRQQQEKQQQQQAAARPPPAATSLAAGIAPPSLPPAVVAADPPPHPPAPVLGSLGYPHVQHFDAEYTLGELIGAGASGRVHQATHRASGRGVAVKILPKRREGRAGAAAEAASGSRGTTGSSSGGSNSAAEDSSRSSPSRSASTSASPVDDPCCRAAAIRREISATAAASAGSPFAARLEAVYESEGDALLVLEACEGGDLRALLSARAGEPLPEPLAAAVLRGVLHALSACHARGMVYGDVKPGNVCLLRRRASVEREGEGGGGAAAAAPAAAASSRSSSSLAADADADRAFFGGVRLVDWGAASPAPLHPAALSGSPLYWAPEQAVGFAAAGAMLAGFGSNGGDGSNGGGDEDGVLGGAPSHTGAARGGYGPAVDMWAAGVLAYQLMSGRLPYWGGNAGGGNGAGGGGDAGAPPRGLRPWQLLAAIRTSPISAWPGGSAKARDPHPPAHPLPAPPPPPPRPGDQAHARARPGAPHHGRRGPRAPVLRQARAWRGGGAGRRWRWWRWRRRRRERERRRRPASAAAPKQSAPVGALKKNTHTHTHIVCNTQRLLFAPLFFFPSWPFPQT